MHWREFTSPLEVPRLDAVQMWLIAGFFFGLGDIATTVVGLELVGAYELFPIAASLFQYSTLGAMILLKSTMFGICYVLWKWTPRPYWFGVPLGLLLVGVFVTTWNLHIIFRVIFQ